MNIRGKGAGGEREIALELNAIVNLVYSKKGLLVPEKPIVQRNQNQSAVGGADLVGTFGYSIEVKRQETLAINQWWVQCVQSANRTGEVPVLLFRQNGGKWRCVTMAAVPCGQTYKWARAEISFDDFKLVFQAKVEADCDLFIGQQTNPRLGTSGQHARQLGAPS